MGIVISIGVVNLLICSLISYSLGPFINNIGLKLRILDIPDQRKIHKKPIVRIGGLTIVFTFFIYIFLTYKFIPYFEIFNLRIIALLVGSLIYFFLGLHDDIYRSSPFLRLAIQFFGALIVSLCGVNLSNIYLNLPFIGIISFTLPIIIAHIITCFFIVGLTNAINWLDGLDALAAGHTSIIVFGILFTAYNLNNIQGVLILSVLLGSILGFLIRNFRPALYIMGDCGSYFLGFCLSTGAIYFSSGNNENSVSMIYLLVLFSLPLLDMIFVLLNRIFSSFNPFMPDGNHIHHRMIKAKFKYSHILLFIYIYSILSALFANIFI
tara:strand:- start:921 stop:1889 length:969 start_codon:yes stop_codon:yes gene_type:complete